MSTTIQELHTATATVDFNQPTTQKAPISTLLGKGGNIPDGQGSFQDDLVVTDNFKIAQVSVTLEKFVHTWVGDLIVRLRHVESDTVVELFRRPGQPYFSSSGYSNDLNGDYTFNDYNTRQFQEVAGENSVIPSGNYAPVQSLSIFNNLSSAGTWRLVITDCSAGDSGSLGSWSLNLS